MSVCSERNWRAGRESRAGVVLVAALMLVAFLAVVVTVQLERLQFVSNESRAAARIVQRQLDANSALVLAAAVLRADAAQNDCDGFGDLWARAHSLRIGDTDLELRIGDHVFRRAPDDKWFRHEQGIPEGVKLLETCDQDVQALFAQAKLNLNTAPMQELPQGLTIDGAAWIKRERLERGFRQIEDLKAAPGYDAPGFRSALEGVSFRSSLFLAEARLCRPGEADRRFYWVLWREGDSVSAVHSGYGGTVK